jgi:hypothetical protein
MAQEPPDSAAVERAGDQSEVEPPLERGALGGRFDEG